MSPRVAPVPASSGCASLAPSGCPAVASSGDSGGESPRVASPRPPFSCAGDGSPGCPVSRILQRCRSANPRVAPRPRSACFASRCFRQVAPASAPSGSSGDGASGCPASRILRRCCWRFCGLPRVLARQPRLLAFPPGRPGFRAFRLRRRWSLGLPRVSHPSAMLLPDSAGCPASSLVSLASWRFHRVAPASAPSGCARGESPGRPESSSPLALPQLRPQVALSPAATAGSMMNPRLYSNFASSACAADESSRPIRSCTSLPDSGCSFNLILSARYRQAGHKLTSSNLLCIFLSGRDCVSKSLQAETIPGT
jgi:hypothetical protein